MLSKSASTARALFIIPLFFCLNIALSLLNRFALGHLGFSFPLILTACHALFSFLSMLPMVSVTPEIRHRYRKTLHREWRGILFVGLWLSANIALNNLSLVYIDLPLNQVIRSSIPLVTAAFSAISERRIPERTQLLGLLMLCVGVATAIGEASAKGDAFGVLLCVLSVIAGAAQLISTAKTLQGNINSVQLMFLTAPVTFFCLMPPYFVLEHSSFLKYLITDAKAAAFVVIVTSGLAGLYNIVHNDLVAITDPITTCVLGQLKIIVLLVLSAVLLGEGRNFSQKMSIGCTAAILGFSIYSWAKVSPRSRQGKSGATLHSRSGTPATPKSSINKPRLPLLVVDLDGNSKATPEATLPGLYTPGKLSSRRSVGSSRQRSSSAKKTPGRLV